MRLARSSCAFATLVVWTWLFVSLLHSTAGHCGHLIDVLVLVLHVFIDPSVRGTARYCPSSAGCAVEIAVGGLRQTAVWPVKRAFQFAPFLLELEGRTLRDGRNGRIERRIGLQ
jgi:hypothetical protein